jgi:hypothetical protein
MSYQNNGVTVNVTFDFSNGATFGYPLILNDPKNGLLGKGYLADAIPQIVDISDQVGNISIRGGYNLLQDQFQAGTCSFRLYDPNGDWNPTNPLSPYYPNLVPLRKVRISATYANNDYYLFSGYVTAYKYTYPKDQSIGYVDIDAVDGFRLLQLANVTTIPGAIAGQDTGTRINKILDDVSWPNSLREITTGGTETVLQADPGNARTALEAVRLVEFTEQGAFYFDGEGDAVFHSRAYVMGTSGKDPYYFNNDGTGIGYNNIKFAHDDKLIINDAIIQNIGGTPQEVTNLTSSATYFPHSIHQSNLLAQTDQDALNIALNYVATRAFTTIRIDAMTLDLSTPDYAAGILAALKIDYFNTLDIKNVGPDGTIIHKVLQCLGMAYEITPQKFLCTFTTSEPIVGSFILDSTIYGIIGDPAYLSILGY